ncbi:hypothetical protein AMK13_31740 [Streptomyces sp. CB02056]|nr:hypothetical protein AMK13_31740 [Streptomyces sp. CB02056]
MRAVTGVPAVTGGDFDRNVPIGTVGGRGEESILGIRWLRPSRGVAAERRELGMTVVRAPGRALRPRPGAPGPFVPTPMAGGLGRGAMMAGPNQAKRC